MQLLRLFNNLSLFLRHHIPIRLRNTSKTQYQRLQYVTWVGSTSALILVMANDIYLRPSPISDQDYRLTFSGQSDLIYNGIPDWLYQGKFF